MRNWKFWSVHHRLSLLLLCPHALSQLHCRSSLGCSGRSLCYGAPPPPFSDLSAHIAVSPSFYPSSLSIIFCGFLNMLSQSHHHLSCWAQLCSMAGPSEPARISCVQPWTLLTEAALQPPPPPCHLHAVQKENGMAVFPVLFTSISCTVSRSILHCLDFIKFC